MNKTIIVLYYPETFAFETEETLPEFEFDCPVRTRIVQQQIEEQGIDTPYHSIDEYMVEGIYPWENGEIWELGT